MKSAFIILYLFIALPVGLHAQFNILGRVTSADDGKPLPGASVFISNTTMGTNTDIDGNFKLTNLTPGKYEVVFSMVGFTTSGITVNLINKDVQLPVVKLLTGVNNLREVTVTAHESPDRAGNLEIFKSTFIGNSERAKQTRILNPELIDISNNQSTGIMSAKSIDFLVIENRALGYKLRYLLESFLFDQKAGKFAYEGPVQFEPLKGTDEQQAAWQKQRNQLYHNSLVSFLKAAVSNKLKDNGFTVFRMPANPDRAPDSLINAKLTQFNALRSDHRYRDSLAYWEKQEKLPRILPKQKPVEITASEFITKRGRPGMYSFSCDDDALLVIYRDGDRFRLPTLADLHPDNASLNTLVLFNKLVVYFNAEGKLVNPDGLTFTGAWANQRVADLLPTDFQPEKQAAVDTALYKRIGSALANQSAEKAYLQIDKPFYAAGDTLYFKAYLLQSNLKPADVESSLNIDLVNPDGSRADRLRLKINAGSAAGDIALADTLATGNYRIVAYSNTVNGPAKVLFDKKIPVVNGSNETKTQAKTTKSPARNQASNLRSDQTKAGIDVQFFAEGGNLLDGVNNKVAFKAINSSGAGIEISGYIADDAGNKICEIRSHHLGMGVFELKPEPGKTYCAVILYGDGRKTTANLPKVSDQGYGLSLNNTDPRQLVLNVSSAQIQPGKVSVVGESNGHICYFSTPVLTKGKFSDAILTDALPEGIIRFTLFSNQGEPMNERLVFVRKSNQMMLSIKGLRKEYRAREKTAVNLQCIDEEGKTVTGNFSMSVINESLLPANATDERNIFTNLLLTSAISGYVEQPAYYFSEAPEANTDLDVLMLTQGYREFQWKTIFNSKSASDEPENGLFVSGAIRNLQDKPMPGAKVTMTSVSKAFFSIDTVADKNGHFVFRHYPVEGMRYMIQAADQTLRKKSVIELDDYHPPIKPSIHADNQDSTFVHQLQNYGHAENRFLTVQTQKGWGKHGILLKEVSIKDRAEKKQTFHSDNLNGAGNANIVITAKQIPPGYFSLTDFLQTHLGRMKIRSDGNFYYANERALVLIDGIEVPSMTRMQAGKAPAIDAGPSQSEVLSSIGITNIASIELIFDAAQSAIYGVRGAGGVIIITTKHGQDMLADIKDAPINYRYYTPVPYYKARTFYAPKYVHEQNGNKYEDLRTTVYWNPSITTSGTGSNMEFYNTDLKGSYRIVIEGVDDMGRPGRAIYHYDVK